MKRSLSIHEWHLLANEGAAPPVRITLNGNSMYPLVRRNRDHVTIITIREAPKVGDIVLFYEPGRERYVVHRVWKKKDGWVMTWGDNCSRPDGWIISANVWGKVILIERGRRKIKPEPKSGMLWARVWHLAVKIIRLCRRIYVFLQNR